MESLRLEVEYLYRNADVMGSISGLDAEIPLDSHRVMANAVIDFPVADWLTPYVGVGVGLTRLNSDVGGGFFSQGVDSGLAYQGIVGLSVPFSEQMSFFADTRYLRTEGLNLSLSPQAGSQIQSFSALAGFRFTFGN